MFSQRKNKRFNYQTRFSSEEEQKRDVLKDEFRSHLKRVPKQNNTKVSTLIVLIGLLVVVGIVMYMLESKMN
ncbi:hypothetical protein [Aurantibacter sp.]|uniref:hypothetical protein n=1 Tax=Aurantibacter sp. TaxID=2807103 RepID=UPI0035C7DD90